MTAGRGLIHAEVSSDEFKKNGGKLEILQLWINLPSRQKMVPPAYIGFQKEQIPAFTADNGKVKVNVISGYWGETKGAYDSLNSVQMNTIEFASGGKLNTKVSTEENIFLYVVKGSLIINGQDISIRQLVEFNNDGEEVSMSAVTESYVIFGHAKPFNEPVVAHGPFVMNTMEEIREAYTDYKSGKFGKFE